jgi:phosphatidate cytidylyltransferase
MSNLLSRILVAAVLLPVAVAVLWFGGVWILAAGVLIAILGLHELWTMARPLRPVPLAGYLGAVAMVVAAWFEGIAGLALVLGPVLLVIFILGAAAPGPAGTAVGGLGVTLFGVVWVGGGLGAIVILREISFDTVLAVLLGTWAADIGAYAIGRMIGRRKLAPAISPGKTWEGFIAGVVAGTAVVWWILYGTELGSVAALIVGLAVAITGPFGDLLESYVKRDLGVKDSGRLLAGHGGVLDRIDATLISAPVAMVALFLLT